MKNAQEHIAMESDLHEAFHDIRNTLRAMIMGVDGGIFPEEIIRKFVDSIVGVMGDAQESICETCPVNKRCPTKDRFANNLRLGGYAVLKLELEQLFGNKGEKILPLDFSTKFMEELTNEIKKCS